MNAKTAYGLLAGGLLAAFLLAWGVVQAGQAQSYQDLVRQVTEAIESSIKVQEEFLEGLMIYDERVEHVVVSRSGEWGTGLIALFDPETGEPLPTEPALALSQFVDGAWQVWIPGAPDWPDKVHEAPAEIFPGGEKGIYLEYARQVQVTIPIGPLGGYFLPWEGGKSVNITNSVCHDIYLTSGQGHYSFDFAVFNSQFNHPSRFFNIHAAKGGTVQLWKDDVPTCYDPTCAPSQPLGNYIVIKDSTTTPTTYMLYLHLEQGSIPDELKQKGTPVYRGQFLARVDNTGQSYGHHLHFQVQVALYGNPDDFTGYWGQSVDITFNEVNINGGRPRARHDFEGDTQNKVGLPGPTCCNASDVCNNWQTSYVSANYTEKVPPTGGVTGPGQGTYQGSSVMLQGWGFDADSGLSSGQFYWKNGSSWQLISPNVSHASGLINYTWDMCAVGVPDGPVTVAIKLWDLAGNASAILSPHTFIKQASCPPPPPACLPAPDQVALFSQPDYKGGDCLLLGASGLSPLNLFQGRGGAEAYDLRAVWAGKNVASVLIGSQMLLTLHQGVPSPFDGRSQTFDADNANLADDRFANGVATFSQVMAKTQPPLLPPLPSFPPNAAVVSQGESFTLVWDDDGLSTEFLAELYTPNVKWSSGWTSDAFWHLGSLDVTGLYTWTVQSRNIAGESLAPPGVWSFSVITSTVSFPPPTNGLSTTLEGDVSGWHTSGLWYLDNTQAHSGTRSFRYGQPLGTYNTGGVNYGSLTSPPVNVTSTGQVLQFWYRHHTEGKYTNWDQRWVQISVNGGPFTNLVQLSDDLMEHWLKHPSISLAAYVGQTIQVRFYFATMDELNNDFGGWWVDNLFIGSQTPIACGAPPDGNNTPATATTLPLNTPYQAIICGPGDVDYYKFTAQAGMRLEINVDANILGSPLDAHAFLYDADGTSLLIENDDELVNFLIDPLINYHVPRTGIYYLKIRAWDHPHSGSAAHSYAVTTNAAPPEITAVSVDGDIGQIQYLPRAYGENLPLQITTANTGSDIVKATFKYHTADWYNGTWQTIGTDTNGADGWSVIWNTTAIPEQNGLAILYQLEDRSGNIASYIAWDLRLDRTPPAASMTALSPQMDTTAFPIHWNATDANSGVHSYDIQINLNNGGWADWFPGIIPDTRSTWYFGVQGDTVSFRLRARDNAGNVSAFTTPQTALISLCTNPDIYEAGAGDNTYENATVYQGPFSQQRNLCLPGDEDWIVVTLTPGQDYYLAATAASPTIAVLMQIYTTETITATRSVTLTLLAESAPEPASGAPVTTVFGRGTAIAWTPTVTETVLVRIQHILPDAVAGDGVRYTFAVLTPRIFMPVIYR